MVSLEYGFERAKHLLKRPFVRYTFIGLLSLLFGFLSFKYVFRKSLNPVDELYQCAVPSMIYVPPMINKVIAIQEEEFIRRRDRLASTLASENIDAFIMEPTISMNYYANISSNAWGLSERPFLGIVFAEEESSGATVFFLLPKFELPRAKELVGDKLNARYITWDEDENPYQVLYDTLGPSKLMIDGTVRHFIAQGLQESGFEVVGQSKSVSSLREIKSDAEIDIMFRVNIATVAVIRSVQPCLKPGITELDLAETINRLFIYGGLPPQDSPIVLFGERAAMPHGTPSERSLNKNEFALIDIGTELFGYHSDCTRTVLPNDQKMTKEMENIWNLVFEAQTAGMNALTYSNHTSCASVDRIARNIIREAGYGEFFIHRLGHGLGLEEHENSYLNSANNNTYIQKGNIFTVEPGIYIPDKIGVRIEDAVLVSDFPVLLTNYRANSPYEP
ncbi:X-Pro dipeptidase [Schizosaccharomyces cryophilus OY26]|uniref:X-Pro dipeptidase n=1 Tax=Schizosaccharomyces cryophilus (strain OY26 / ATCC MYA-4695 / CBS 11777 / NBRC 106824 / NRRL Y48691) TaxID=653667 RepID=S9X9T3_SCHCR|nr:X-Pro dipeptidase [Schizosaccharomyces cryophilus OY26]EPY53902.1 X-Pro dipeptidase [Schizosaccharomyces cryophilus OY26]